MDSSRRKFLKLGLGGAILASIPLSLQAATPAAKHPFLVWVSNTCTSRLEALRLISKTGGHIAKYTDDGDRREEIGDAAQLVIFLLKDDEDSKFIKWVRELKSTEEYKKYKETYMPTSEKELELIKYARFKFFKDYKVIPTENLELITSWNNIKSLEEDLSSLTHDILG